MFSLLRDPKDWERYKAELAQREAFKDHEVSWGRGPHHYPCLVETLVLRGPIRLMSAYVYEENARQLLDACPQHVAAAPAPAQDRGAWPEWFKEVWAKQQAFNHHLTADFLTVVYFLVATGICKEEGFEQKQQEFTAFVDQTNAERRHTLGPIESGLLDRLPGAG